MMDDLVGFDTKDMPQHDPDDNDSQNVQTSRLDEEPEEYDT